MKSKMQKLIPFILAVMIDFLLLNCRFSKVTTDIGNTSSNSIRKTWEQVPLRTEEQKEAGLIGGEGMQLIWGLGFAPSNPEVLYLVSDTSQVWKSEDGGNSWEMRHKGFLANGGISLAIDPANENVVFVAGSQHDLGYSDHVADGVYRTQDGGENWELVEQTRFYRLENLKGGVNFAFSGNSIVYAGTHKEGLLKSTDGGDAWSSLDVLSDTKILDLQVNPQDSSVLFIASETGLFKLTDRAEITLEQIGSDLPDVPRAVAINPNDSDIMYVSAGNSGIQKSTDGGNTFAACNNGLEPLDWDNGYEATYLAMSPVNPDYLYVSFYMLGGNHPYYTHDGGESWHAPTVMDNGDLVYGINDDKGGEYWGTPIVASPIDENVAIASGAANHIEKTTDGGNTWTYSGNGYTGGRASAGSTSFGWDLSDPDRFAVFLTDFGAVLTEDGGSTFRNLRTGRYDDAKAASVGAIDPTPGSGVIVAAIGSNISHVIAVTRDEGETWTLISGTDDYYDFIAFHPQNPNIIYAGKYKSSDKGYTWDEMSREVSAVFRGDGDVVYAIETEDYETTIFKSTDGGITWGQPYGVGPFCDVEEIAIDPGEQDRIYVATLWEGVFIWDGSTWLHKTETSGFERDRFGTLSTKSIAIDPRHPNVVYAARWIAFRGHANGVFRSLDYGQSWEDVTFNLDSEFTPWSISVNPHNGCVYIGSSHGTWRLPPPYHDRVYLPVVLRNN